MLDPEHVLERAEALRDQIGVALEAFARNTVEHMVEERELLSGKIELPRFETDFRDRDALIVVRGVDHQRDLRTLRPYVRDVARRSSPSTAGRTPSAPRASRST